MSTDVLGVLRSLDREKLMERMATELPDIRRELGVSQEDLSEKTGVAAAKLRAAENDKRSLRWSEFMAILFVIWNNDIGRGILESKGLFPTELKEALSVNKNAHAPETVAYD